MSAEIKIDFDTNKLKKDIDRKSSKALAVGTSELRRFSQPYVRFQTGMTAKSAFRASEIDKGLLIYDTPYARYAYFNTSSEVTTDHNPNATAKWAEVAWDKHHSRIIQTIEKEIKR